MNEVREVDLVQLILIHKSGNRRGLTLFEILNPLLSEIPNTAGIISCKISITWARGGSTFWGVG